MYHPIGERFSGVKINLFVIYRYLIGIDPERKLDTLELFKTLIIDNVFICNFDLTVRRRVISPNDSIF